MYYPSQSYEIKIAENPNKGNFSVWFTNKPEKTVQHIFQAMDFHMRRSEKEFVAEGKKAMDFALLMKVCLALGEFPKIIPYERSYPPVRSSIDSDNIGIAYYYLEVKPDVEVQEKRLFFERFADKREGVAGLYGLITYGDKLKSFAIPKRPGHKEAKSLFRSKEITSTLPMPFGTYSKGDQPFSISEQTDEVEISPIEKLETEELKVDALENITDLEEVENKVVSEEQLEQQKEVNSELETQIIEESIPNTETNLSPKLNTQNNTVENTEIFASKALEDQVEEEIVRTQKNVLSESDTEINVSSNSEEEIFVPQNLDAENGEAEINLESEIQKENYVLFHKIASGFKKAFNVDLNFAESKSKESHFEKINVLRNSEIESHLVDVTIELIPSKDDDKTQSISLRLHLKEKEALVTKWEASGTEKEYEQVEFSELIENLLYEGHLFELWEKKEERNQRIDNIATNTQYPLGKAIIQSISITENKRSIEDFQVFSTWEDANKWLETRTRNSNNELTIHYSIRWSNNQIIASNFDLFSEHFHPQYEVQLLQKAAVNAILYTQYQKEGRFSSFQSQIPVKKNNNKNLGSIFEKVDLGEQVETFKQLFQPKIPIASLEIKSSLIPLMAKTYEKGQEFKRANDLLFANKTSRSSEETIEITGVWKDGTNLNTKVKLKSVSSEPNSSFWQTIIASFTTDQEPLRYQTDDDQPLLFSNELPIQRPQFYYKNLLAAYWYSSDTDSKERVRFQENSFHREELSRVIQQYLNQLEDEDENDLIELSKSSPRWRLVVKFLIEYKKLQAYDTNLQLASILQLINNAVVSDNEESKTVLSGLLIKIRDGEVLADLPAKRADQYVKLKKQSKKAEDRRIDTNREIEALLKEKGTDLLKYSSDELAKLSEYSGYGGSKLSEINKGLLYEYYTPDKIIRLMWGFAFKHGYSSGAVLEPSCGIGKFLQYAPKIARIEGYEINKYSAQIAQLLYPKAKIYNKSFEHLFFNGNIYLKGKFRTDPFQLVIGNPPYGSFSGKYAGMGEKKRTKAFTYDQYFLTRGLDLLVSGGLLILIIPQSFLDNNAKYIPLKERVASKADFVEARRLPHGIFEYTEVGTDIVVFRKR